VNALKQDGIDIARRTVAKYREALKIPSSVQRRRIKKNLAD
jgi:RNA polymerase sigma-54 factor